MCTWAKWLSARMLLKCRCFSLPQRKIGPIILNYVAIYNARKRALLNVYRWCLHHIHRPTSCRNKSIHYPQIIMGWLPPVTTCFHRDPNQEWFSPQWRRRPIATCGFEGMAWFLVGFLARTSECSHAILDLNDRWDFRSFWRWNSLRTHEPREITSGGRQTTLLGRRLFWIKSVG